MQKEPTLNSWQRVLLGLAIKHLGEAVALRNDAQEYEILREISQAEKNLNELRQIFHPVVWEEKQANVSRLLHTYLRKYDDTDQSSLLYFLINQEMGFDMWKIFVCYIESQIKDGKLLEISKKVLSRAKRLIRDKLLDASPNDKIMGYAIICWTPDEDMLNFIVENS